MLAAEAEKNNVKVLYTASLEALSADDKTAVNNKFKAEASAYSAIKPLAVIDLNDQDKAVGQLEELEGFAGVLISPYLHNYKLDYNVQRRFFDRCSELAIPIWINATLSDDRFRDPELTTRNMNAAEIAEFAAHAPENKYVFQGINALSMLEYDLPGYCYMECSKIADGEYTAGSVLGNGNAAASHVVFGSEYPFRDYDGVKKVLLGEL
jgi:predicted TIM-barrel fold metal-dependent hydrolase